jgi:hypothetical protein
MEASAMIAKFAIISGKAISEFRELNRTSKHALSVSLMMPKFALGPISELWRTPASGH